MPSKYLNYVLNILIRAFFSRISRIGFVRALSQCTLGETFLVRFPVSVKSFVTCRNARKTSGTQGSLDRGT